MRQITSSYLTVIFQPEMLSKLVKRASRILDKTGIPFDTIAFRGTSGTMVAPALAMKMRKEMVVVHKNVDRHTSLKLEGNYGLERYIIVDDFVRTGSTLYSIREAIESGSMTTRNAKCVGLFCYRQTTEEIKDHFMKRVQQFLPDLEFTIGIDIS